MRMVQVTFPRRVCMRQISAMMAALRSEGLSTLIEDGADDSAIEHRKAMVCS
jgi:hypothetical protein